MTYKISGATTIGAQYEYSPFGQVNKITGSSEADFQYADYYLHSRSSLNSMLFRVYSSLAGRFIRRDPINEKGGVNLYSYVSNSPINHRDALGLCDDDEDEDIDPPFNPRTINEPTIEIAFLPVPPLNPRITSPFKDREKGVTDDSSCQDNLVGCYSAAQKARRRGLITRAQEVRLRQCCLSVHLKCVKKDKFEKENWKECWRRIAPNVILVDRH